MDGKSFHSIYAGTVRVSSLHCAQRLHIQQLITSISLLFERVIRLWYGGTFSKCSLRYGSTLSVDVSTFWLRLLIIIHGLQYAMVYTVAK